MEQRLGCACLDLDTLIENSLQIVKFQYVVGIKYTYRYFPMMIFQDEVRRSNRLDANMQARVCDRHATILAWK